MKNAINIFISTVIILCAGTIKLPAANYNGAVAKILHFYKKGAYVQALEHLAPLSKNKKMASLVNYWSGLCHSKLQQYDLAVKFFEMALGQKSNFQDLHYEYGQALFAIQELEKARKAFARSIKRHFQIPTSLYYIGNISQTLDDTTLAISVYRKIPLLKGVPIEIIQASQYQIGEILLTESEKKKNAKQLIESVVIPQFERAQEINPQSVVGRDIDGRLMQIKKLYALPLGPSDHSFNLKFKEVIEYDTNVINEAERPTARAVNTASWIFKTNIDFAYDLKFPDTSLSASPGLKIDFNHYGERNQTAVYRNDGYGITPELLTQWEYILWGKPWSLLMEADYQYQEKDVFQNYSYAFYGKTYSATIGQNVKLMPFGDTTLKYQRKEFVSHSADADTATDNIQLSQSVMWPNKHLMVLMANIDLLKADNDNNSTQSYMMRLDYIIPNIFEQITMTNAFSYTALDTKKQLATRGIEKTYNPSIKFSRSWPKKLKWTLKIEHTTIESKEKSAYAYSKNIIGMELQFKL